MAFLLALLGFIVAGDVVGLEPVVATSPGNNFGCDRWSGASTNQTKCESSPYCRWYGSGGTYKCYDDPCLKLMNEGETCEAQISIDGSGVSAIVNCEVVSALKSKFEGGDCGDVTAVVDLCIQTSYNASLFSYCVYAQLRDGSCPASVCREFPWDGLDTKLSKQCLPNVLYGDSATNSDYCHLLSTSDECGRVPNCYWKGSSDGCVKDPCFTAETSIQGTCENYKPGGDTTIKCKEFKPYTKGGGGSVATYCVISDNSSPNLCYQGNPNYLNVPSYGAEYLTLEIDYTAASNGSIISKPDCTLTATTCSNMGDDCVLMINKKGGFAGAYCDDGAHGAANILRIPSLLVVFLIVLFSIFH